MNELILVSSLVSIAEHCGNHDKNKIFYSSFRGVETVPELCRMKSYYKPRSKSYDEKLL